MNQHKPSPADLAFRNTFEAANLQPGQFTHFSHIRLAYTYLCEMNAEAAYASAKKYIQNYLNKNQIDPLKYNETITHAWIIVMANLMESSTGFSSAESFVAHHPQLKTNVLLNYYSKDLLFSDRARTTFVPPDIKCFDGVKQRLELQEQP